MKILAAVDPESQVHRWPCYARTMCNRAVLRRRFERAGKQPFFLA
jgi:hypothetical protein